MLSSLTFRSKNEQRQTAINSHCRGIEDLYSVPSFNESYQRFYFALNDKELAELSRIRQRKYRCVAVALLGYFKCKPILLNRVINHAG
nr:DUF4158 domain-containing protein [Moraxella osloensis]